MLQLAEHACLHGYARATFESSTILCKVMHAFHAPYVQMVINFSERTGEE
jgi:hypothetical protein